MNESNETVTAPQPVRATWNFSTDAFLEAAAGYSEEAREIMLACFRWCIDAKHPVPRAEFSRRVGYDDTTVYKFYSNKYRDPDNPEPKPPPERFLRSCREFLKLERERYLGGETAFVLTPTAKRVQVFCDLTRESRSMAMLYGASHVGKTWAVEQYTQENNHGRTIYVRMHAACGLGGMIRSLASACGISDKSNTSSLIERIKHGLTEDTLLILDEMHLLANTYRVNSFFACVEVIREIHDETHCGMVLIWTQIETLQRHSQRELQQVWRRGVHKLALPPMPTRGDVEAILQHVGLELPEPKDTVTVGRVTEHPAELLRQVAKNDGLKAITERIRYGRKFASRAGEKLGWPHIVKAHLTIAAQTQPDEKGGWE